MLGKPSETINCQASTWNPPREEGKRKAMEHPADTKKETRMDYTRKELEKMTQTDNSGILWLINIVFI